MSKHQIRPADGKWTGRRGVGRLNPRRENKMQGKNGDREGRKLSDIRAFGITGDWETMAVKAEVWVEAVTEGGRRFMAAWRQEEEDAARHRQEKREATRLGKLQSHTEA